MISAQDQRPMSPKPALPPRNKIRPVTDSADQPADDPPTVPAPPSPAAPIAHELVVPATPPAPESADSTLNGAPVAPADPATHSGGN